MMKKLPFLLAIFFLLFPIGNAHAQGISLSISPPILEVLIKPGKSITQAFKIANDGEPVVLVPKIVSFNQSGLLDDPKNPPPEWINLVNLDLKLNEPFMLTTNQSRQLILRVNPPQNAAEKDYYYALIFTSLPTPANDSTQSSISQTIGSPLFISVSKSGILLREGQIIKFEAPSLIDSFDPLLVNIDLKNVGGSYFRPVGKINLKGNLIRGSYDINPNIVLVGQSRRITTSNFSDRTLELSGLFIGKYTVETDFTLDESIIRLNSVKTFYAVPWKAGIIILAVFAVIIKLKLRKKKTK